MVITDTIVMICFALTYRTSGPDSEAHLLLGFNRAVYSYHYFLTNNSVAPHPDSKSVICFLVHQPYWDPIPSLRPTYTQDALDRSFYETKTTRLMKLDDLLRDIATRIVKNNRLSDVLATADAYLHGDYMSFSRVALSLSRSKTI